MPTRAKQIVEPFLRWDRTRADDDRGQVTIQHRHAFDACRGIERIEPAIQPLEAHAPFHASRTRTARGHATAASRAAFHSQGSNSFSAFTLVRPEMIRSSTSVSQVWGSTPCNFAVLISDARIAHRSPPESDPAKRAFFRPNGIGRMARSTVLLSTSTRPSDKNTVSPFQ